MKLSFALLADFAEATADGKLTLGGGDFDAVFAPAFPAVHSRNTALVVRATVEPEDVGTLHSVRVEFASTDTDPVLLAFESEFRTEMSQNVPGAATKMAFIVNFPMLYFPVAGQYAFRVFIDHQVDPFATVPVFAVAQDHVQMSVTVPTTGDTP